MKQTGRILLMLLKKNNTQPGIFQTLILLAGLASISVLYVFRRWPAEAFLPVLLSFVVIGTAVGAAAFTVDLKAGNIRFLEYLPVRRSHIWLANIGDAMLWLGVMVLAATLGPTMVWRPPEPSEWIDPLEHVVLGHRWMLMSGGVALAFCALACAVFYRLLYERESMAILRASAAANLIVFGAWAIPAALRLFPSLYEGSIVLGLVGLMFAAGSYIVFVHVPSDWGRLRRWLLVSLPAIVVPNVIALLVVAAACVVWSRYRSSPSDQLRVEVASTLAGRPVFVTVQCRRSGDHLFRVDGVANIPRHSYIGRGVQTTMRRGAGEPGVKVVLSAAFADDGLWPTPNRMLSMNADGTDRRDLLRGHWVHWEGRRYRIYQPPQWSADGRWMVYSGMLENGSGAARVFVADAAGTVRRALEAAYAGDFAIAPDGRVVVGSPQEQPADAALESRYLLYDPAGDALGEFIVPGALLACARDLSVALAVRREQRGDAHARMLLAVDLSSGATRTLLDEPVLGQDRDEYTRSYARHPSQLFLPEGDVLDNAPFAVDQRFEQLVVVPSTNAPSRRSMHWVNVRSGEHRVLVPAGQLSPDSGRYMQFHGFTAAGDAVLYSLESQLLRVATASGETTVMARLMPEESQRGYEFSPGKHRVLAHTSNSPAGPEDPDGSRQVHYARVWVDGQLVLERSGTQRPSLTWLDDEHLLEVRGRRLYVMAVDGSQRRPVFDAATARAAR